MVLFLMGEFFDYLSFQKSNFDILYPSKMSINTLIKVTKKTSELGQFSFNFSAIL